ncbi:MAG: ABC transporter permease [Opitutaceae bacterium]|nr:ABC transporter permease [Opitutaceae bacterium]
MSAILVIAWNDVRLFLRDRTAYLWLFVMPLAFVWVMGFAARGPGGPEDARPRVLVDNRDTGFMGRVFLKELGQQGLEIVTPGSEHAADARRGITVPADFTERVLAMQQVKLDFFTIEGSDIGNAQIVQLRLGRVIIALNAHLARLAIDTRGAPPTEAGLGALIDAPPAVALQVSHAGRKPQPVGMSFSLPGNLVGYTFLNVLIFGGASVADQRRSGVIRRLAVNPLSRLQLLGGKILGLMLLAFVQSAGMLAAGQFLFKVPIGDSLGGILLVMGVLGWVAASFGVLIGSLARAEDKVIGICLAIGLPAAAIGGCWWPLELAGDFFKRLAHAVPNGWALDALHQLITYGSGLGAIVTPLLALAAFGLAANVAAARWFRA